MTAALVVLTDGQMVGAVIVLAMVTLCAVTALEFAAARFRTHWEATRWRWYKETGEWVE